MTFLAGFGGFIAGLVVGAIGGVICYWYIVIHRKKINIPEDIPTPTIGLK